LLNGKCDDVQLTTKKLTTSFASLEQFVAGIDGAAECDFDKLSRKMQKQVFTKFALQYPPMKAVPRLLHEPGRRFFSEAGQDEQIDKLFNEKQNGFFIEAGAYDGEYHSNTLFLEMTRNWTGLLIEPNPRAYRELLMKDRRVYATSSCIRDKFSIVPFLAYGMEGGIVDNARMVSRVQATQHELYASVINVTCFPLDVMLESVGVTQVDVFSLDVEGSELDVLKSIPFSRVNIKMFVIEASDNTNDVSALLTKHNYRNVASGSGFFWMRD